MRHDIITLLAPSVGLRMAYLLAPTYIQMVLLAIMLPPLAAIWLSKYRQMRPLTIAKVYLVGYVACFPSAVIGWFLFSWHGENASFGLSTVGGLVGAGVCCFAYTSLVGLSALRVLDTLAGPVCLSLSLSKLGCFLEGCCYGTISKYGVSFPRESYVWKAQVTAGELSVLSKRSLAVVPIQFYESAAYFAISIVAMNLLKAQEHHRRIGLVTIALACVVRVLAENFRDETRVYLGSINTVQVFCAVVAVTLSFAAFASNRGRP